MSDSIGALAHVQEAVDRLAAAGLVTPDKPHAFTADGMRTLTDVAVFAMVAGRGGAPLDRAMGEAARALLNLAGAVSADAAGQDSSEFVGLVRQAEQALKAGSKILREF